MKYLARFALFILFLISVYVVLPIIFLIFSLVYLVWNFRWIPKSEMKKVTNGWQEISLGSDLFDVPERNYSTPFHYLMNTQKPKTRRRVRV